MPPFNPPNSDDAVTHAAQSLTAALQQNREASDELDLKTRFAEQAQALTAQVARLQDVNTTIAEGTASVVELLVDVEHRLQQRLDDIERRLGSQQAQIVCVQHQCEAITEEATRARTRAEAPLAIGPLPPDDWQDVVYGQRTALHKAITALDALAPLPTWIASLQSRLAAQENQIKQLAATLQEGVAGIVSRLASTQPAPGDSGTSPTESPRRAWRGG